MTAGPAVWVEAARPNTLSAAVAPVLVGTAAAERFLAWRFAAALVVALAVQVAVNYANDYFDGTRGVDTADRVGPRRVVSAGLVAPATMRLGIVAALAVAALAGLALSAATTWWLLLVGLAAFAATLGYSGGPRPYASAGLGELFVFIFFGLAATAGSAFVQDEAVPLAAWLAAVPVGLLAVAVLMANNLRDLSTDAVAGKRTLAVRLGERGTRLCYVALLASAFAGVPAIGLAAGSGWPLLALGAAPLAIAPARFTLEGAVGHRLIGVLVGTARTHLAFGALLAAGLLLAGGPG
ncbi:MAG: 1,4-dihydroxy-2-naphthoate polyprenyltransferase [Euzebyales bacterium]|nr:1,4-dihydroxy-2-naphthoate polyprenyltransferase [Euzebyales bacterium]